MKKLGIFICALFVVSMVGCNTKPKTPANQGTAQGTKTPVTTTKTTTTTTTTPAGTQTKGGTNTTKAKYKDGIYTAYGDKWQFGQESATVKIKNGKMINVVLHRLDTNGKEVNYSQWTGQKEANGSVKPNLKKYRSDMAKRMLANQTYLVNTISGATVSTGGWKIAVQRALDKAKQ